MIKKEEIIDNLQDLNIINIDESEESNKNKNEIIEDKKEKIYYQKFILTLLKFKPNFRALITNQKV